MEKTSPLTIGKLARQSSVNVETVKFYEKKGLLPKPAKPANGFRKYPQDYSERISFIKRAQELGFTLREVKELLKLRVDKKATCGQVQKRAEEKLQEIELKIRDLQQMTATLKTIKDCCEDKTLSLTECPILDCFAGRKDCCTPAPITRS